MRCVIVRLSALGDIIHTWPLAELLRAGCRDLHLTWVVEAGFRPVVEGHPAVDAVLEVRTRSWRRRPWRSRVRQEVSAFRAALRELSPDIALDPQGLVKSALVTRWSRAPRRIGFAGPWRRELLAGLAYTETVTGAARSLHVVATNLELARRVGITPPESVPAPSGRWLLDGVSASPLTGWQLSGYAVILPGAGEPSKILPVRTLAELAAGIVAHGLAVVVAWGPGEESRAREVAAAAGRGVEVAPPTDLRQLAWLLARSSLVIGADTGPVHLAASLGVPTVGCYLATDWRRNGPLGDRVAVVSGAATSADPTRRARARGVRELSVDEVLGAALRLLS